jgi:uncharacterized membrane protein YqjE
MDPMKELLSMKLRRSKLAATLELLGTICLILWGVNSDGSWLTWVAFIVAALTAGWTIDATVNAALYKFAQTAQQVKAQRQREAMRR